MKKTLGFLICSSALFACGGGSGVESDKILSTLPADERIQVCEYAVSQFPEPGEYNCTGGQIELESDDFLVSACTQGDFFDEGQNLCTVGVLESCFAEIGKAGSPCAVFATDECRVFMQFCDGGSSSSPPQVGDTPDGGSGSSGSGSIDPGDG